MDAAQVLTVSADTSAESLRSLLGQVRADCAILLLPAGWSGLAHIAELRLLQRQAQQQRLALALVTGHPATRNAAAQVGLPAFYSVAEAEGQIPWPQRVDPTALSPLQVAAALPTPPAWQRAERDVVAESARPAARRWRRRQLQALQASRRPTPGWLPIAGILVAGLTLSLLVAAFTLTVVPSATITLVPGRASLTVDVPLTANMGVAALDPALGLVPARRIETRITGSGSAATSGRAQVGTAKAVGVVSFSNLGRQPLRVPVGTAVRTGTGSPVSFITRNDAELAGEIGARADVRVEAVEPGAQGNVRANTINTVSGPLGFQLRVTNPTNTGGGVSTLVAVVKQEDKDALLEKVYAQVQADAYQRLLANLEPGEWMPPESVRTQILDDSFDRFNDEAAEQVTLNLRVLVQGIAVNEQQATRLAMNALQQSVPGGGKLVADSVLFLRLPGAAVQGAEVAFTLQAGGDYVVPIDREAVRRAVVGLRPGQAQQLLSQSWRLAEPPQIYRDPEWVATLPSLPGRIQVRVDYGQEFTP